MAAPAQESTLGYLNNEHDIMRIWHGQIRRLEHLKQRLCNADKSESTFDDLVVLCRETYTVHLDARKILRQPSTENNTPYLEKLARLSRLSKMTAEHIDVIGQDTWPAMRSTVFKRTEYQVLKKSIKRLEPQLSFFETNEFPDGFEEEKWNREEGINEQNCRSYCRTRGIVWILDGQYQTALKLRDTMDEFDDDILIKLEESLYELQDRLRLIENTLVGKHFMQDAEESCLGESLESRQIRCVCRYCRAYNCWLSLRDKWKDESDAILESAFCTDEICLCKQCLNYVAILDEYVYEIDSQVLHCEEHMQHVRYLRSNKGTEPDMSDHYKVNLMQEYCHSCDAGKRQANSLVARLKKIEGKPLAERRPLNGSPKICPVWMKSQLANSNEKATYVGEWPYFSFDE